MSVELKNSFVAISAFGILGAPRPQKEPGSREEAKSQLSELILQLRECELVENIIERSAKGAQPAKRITRRRRKQSIEPKLTEKQMEAMQIVGECKGDIADAARRLGKDRSTIDQHYKSALIKLGKGAVKHSTKRHATDGRGQANIATDADKRL